MGTSTTARGAMVIPGEAEADWIFTAGLHSPCGILFDDEIKMRKYSFQGSCFTY
jgi:hypothetical protein